MPTTTRQWLLNGHPRGRGIEIENDFRLVTTELPDPAPGEMLLKQHYLGFDPAQKGWMENIADYVAPMNIGDVMRGSGIAEVVASNGGRFAVGDMVFGTTGWTEYLVTDGKELTKVETDLSPTAVLSVLGTTGLTAYCGLFKVGRPVAGDTVLVSGAAGATGSIVGQLAKIAGCRVVGIAGGQDKCDWLVREAGYDAAIDYKAGGVKEQIREHCPRGVDVIYDNVGGKILNDMLACIATRARAVLPVTSIMQGTQWKLTASSPLIAPFQKATIASFPSVWWPIRSQCASSAHTLAQVPLSIRTTPSA